MSTSALPTAYAGLVDDAAIFPPGDLALTEALAAYAARLATPTAALVRSLVVRDTDLPAALDAGLPLSIVSTGGAGSLVGPLRLAARRGARVVGLAVALRDLDDLAGNARRVATAVEAARDDGVLADDTEVYVELPAAAQTTSGGTGLAGAWLSAADVVAEHELGLKLRTGGVSADAFPDSPTLARWIDAALDRETPYVCTAGLHRAVAHLDPETGFAHHGFLNVLLATRLAFDGAGLEEVVAVLDERDPTALTGRVEGADLAGARRWLVAFGSCSVDEPWADLRALGLVP